MSIRIYVTFVSSPKCKKALRAITSASRPFV